MNFVILVNFKAKILPIRPKIYEKSNNLPPTVHFLTFTPTVAVTVCNRALSSTMLSQQYCVAPLVYFIQSSLLPLQNTVSCTNTKHSSI